MTKRQVLMLVLMVAVPFGAVAIGFGIAAIMPPPPNVTKASFDRIQEGMTEVDVEQVFRAKGFVVNSGEEWPKVKRMDWKANDGKSWASIGFTNGRVSGMHWEQR